MCMWSFQPKRKHSAFSASFHQPTMVQYVPFLHRFSSVVVGHWLYVLLLLSSLEGVGNFKIGALDFHSNEWAEFDVITFLGFTRIRLLEAHEQGMLVRVEEGILSIMKVSLSTTGISACVEVPEMHEGFCGALVEDTYSVFKFKFKAVLCVQKNGIFFMSSRAVQKQLRVVAGRPLRWRKCTC